MTKEENLTEDIINDYFKQESKNNVTKKINWWQFASTILMLIFVVIIILTYIYITKDPNGKCQICQLLTNRTCVLPIVPQFNMPNMSVLP